MAVFTDILPPPQTLENLDNWGNLDSLSWSLDSSIWDVAGIYGLVVSESAYCDDTIKYSLTRGLTLSDTVHASSSMEGNLIAEIAGTCESTSEGDLLLGRELHVGGEATSFASSSDIFLRISPLMVSEPAVSGGTASVFRVRNAGIHDAFSTSSVKSVFRRVRDGSCGSSAYSNESSALLRLRTFLGAAFAQSSATMEGSRFYGLVAVENAKTSEALQYIRIVQRSALSYVFSQGVLIGGRLLGVVCIGPSQTSEYIYLSRIIELFGASESFSGSKIFPEYKGWNWDLLHGNSGQQWSLMNTAPSIWTEENNVSGSEWMGSKQVQQDWSKSTGGNACWRGVVEWQ